MNYRRAMIVPAMPRRLTFVRLLLILCLCLGSASPAAAAVELTFYSRELGGSFPHAFIRLVGTDDATREAVDTSYGFTARTVSPAILFGSVAGEVLVEGEARIRSSDRQFHLTLSDAQYRTVMGTVEEWRTRPQPSYNLNRANCVHFVAAIATALGLRVEMPQRLMKRPRSFLQHLRDLNPGAVIVN